MKFTKTFGFFASLTAASAFFALGSGKAQASLMPQAGGTLRMVATSSGGSIDPQVNYNVEYEQILQMVYDGLVTFKKANGDAGTEIVADLATSVPRPTDHGLTYSFTLRKGIRFSDGQPVTVAAVRHSFVRLFKVLSPNAGAWYSVIKGGKLCVRDPSACTLPGITVNPKTNRIIFHLSHPDSVFLDQLAMPFASIVPADTPDTDEAVTPLPGTGAYMIKSYNPESGIVFVRNPYFRVWNAAAQPKGYPDKIIYRFGLTPDSQVNAVLQGSADLMFAPIPTERLGYLAEKYPTQLHINPVVALLMLPLNVNIPPFNNKDARLAVNYAVNRNDVAAIMGGRALGTPTCQVLAPGMPGYEPYCPYTKNPGKYWTAPDWAKAEYYMKKSHTAGEKVTIFTFNTPPESVIGVYLQSLLNRLGYKASVRQLAFSVFYTYIQDSANRVQISLLPWYMDYPAPSDFLNTLFGCDSFRPNTEASPNISGYCNLSVQSDMKKAEFLDLTNPVAADKLWAKIDRKVTDQAPMVSLLDLRQASLVSKRVTHFAFSPVYTILPQLTALQQ